MCDYSLHAVPNRLAIEGEELITHRFPTSSIGLASPADFEKATRTRHTPETGTSWWAVVKSWLNPPPLRAEKVCAVCIPPGARLRIPEVPQELQRELGVGRSEEVVFVELSASAYRYRDGIRFANGREILLQYLDEGLRMEVLSLAGTEVVAEPQFEEELHVRSR
jgi:hypothetical protein